MKHRSKIRLKSQDGLPDLDATLNITTDEQGEAVAYIEVNGKRIAKRRPRGPWVSLDRTYRVESGDASDYDTIAVVRLPVQ
jgi:hypothetical protein